MIQVINRAFNILEFIAKDPGQSKSLSEIAEGLNLNAGTCANILKTMIARNYIQKLDKQKGYMLGSMIEGFTGYETSTKNLMQAAKGEIEKLTKQTGENAVLGILKRDIRKVVFTTRGSHDLQANTAAEKRAYATATGRLLISMLPENQLNDFINKYGLPGIEEWPEAADNKGFMKQIRQIEEAGYAMQITKAQIIGFAVPVYNHKNIVAGLSVYMPLTRYTKNEETLVKYLNQCASKIEKKLREVSNV